ncbi:hypothetical protein CONPUDRAFT_160602 [Coniophora puteana RWD-64-598 SS2]|uniref:DUF6532 domain-containing protein n=1 Tax=Coniophora puteana (strain RWD-64-598) TaxID=741705 RepID=R7SDE2_CONPW|nr:uncharacterized protein CONPUDRAFT_160602 [Coniophora puteana RWD-64-598 SS2]EIW73885.1 hypothetical protein CONPUDRAFT_160602 [Coniophora puteana RWD-64-598 SS2]
MVPAQATHATRSQAKSKADADVGDDTAPTAPETSTQRQLRPKVAKNPAPVHSAPPQKAPSSKAPPKPATAKPSSKAMSKALAKPASTAAAAKPASTKSAEARAAGRLRPAIDTDGVPSVDRVAVVEAAIAAKQKQQLKPKPKPRQRKVNEANGVNLDGEHTSEYAGTARTAMPSAMVSTDVEADINEGLGGGKGRAQVAQVGRVPTRKSATITDQEAAMSSITDDTDVGPVAFDPIPRISSWRANVPRSATSGSRSTTSGRTKSSGTYSTITAATSLSSHSISAKHSAVTTKPKANHESGAVSDTDSIEDDNEDVPRGLRDDDEVDAIESEGAYMRSKDTNDTLPTFVIQKAAPSSGLSPPFTQRPPPYQRSPDATGDDVSEFEEVLDYEDPEAIDDNGDAGDAAAHHTGPSFLPASPGACSDIGGSQGDADSYQPSDADEYRADDTDTDVTLKSDSIAEPASDADMEVEPEVAEGAIDAEMEVEPDEVEEDIDPNMEAEPEGEVNIDAEPVAEDAEPAAEDAEPTAEDAESPAEVGPNDETANASAESVNQAATGADAEAGADPEADAMDVLGDFAISRKTTRTTALDCQTHARVSQPVERPKKRIRLSVPNSESTAGASTSAPATTVTPIATVASTTPATPAAPTNASTPTAPAVAKNKKTKYTLENLPAYTRINRVFGRRFMPNVLLWLGAQDSGKVWGPSDDELEDACAGIWRVIFNVEYDTLDMGERAALLTIVTNRMCLWRNSFSSTAVFALLLLLGHRGLCTAETRAAFAERLLIGGAFMCEKVVDGKPTGPYKGSFFTMVFSCHVLAIKGHSRKIPEFKDFLEPAYLPRGALALAAAACFRAVDIVKSGRIGDIDRAISSIVDAGCTPANGWKSLTQVKRLVSESSLKAKKDEKKGKKGKKGKARASAKGSDPATPPPPPDFSEANYGKKTKSFYQHSERCSDALIIASYELAAECAIKVEEEEESESETDEEAVDEFADLPTECKKQKLGYSEEVRPYA